MSCRFVFQGRDLSIQHMDEFLLATAHHKLPEAYQVLLKQSVDLGDPVDLIGFREEYFRQGRVIGIDKPKGWTSFDVVAKLKGRIGVRKLKIGHAGTLDPLASGLLIICTGRATKSIQGFQNQTKEYLVEFNLGGITKTYDAEFAPTDLKETSEITPDQLRATMESFTGEVWQIPPIFSAVHVQGQRAYELARQDQLVDLPPRKVEVYKFELQDFRPGQGDQLAWGKAVVVCSKGTYIRSLIHDMGQKLQVGGFVTELQRTRIGDHTLKQALSSDLLLQETRPIYLTDNPA